MALKIYDTMEPQGDYPAVKATDVEMPDGTRLSDFHGAVTGTVEIVAISQERYYEMLQNEEINPDVVYLIVSDNA